MQNRTFVGRTAALALAAGLALPTLAQAEEANPVAGYAGTIEFNMGLGSGGTYDGKDVDGIDGLALGITPAIDRMLGKSVGIGLETMFWWFGSEGVDDSQFVISPHLRVRMSFPVYLDKVNFDAQLGVGPSIWTSREIGRDPITDKAIETDTRFGWSLRFAFGGSYKINSTVAAFASLGYYTSTTYGDDVTQNLNTIPFSVGLRGMF